MNLTDLLVALVIAVGIMGIVLPVLPGSILILGAVLVWAVMEATGAAWIVFALVTVLLVTGGIVKYVVPGRSLKASGVPTRTLVLGGVLGIVGFFVVPVLGLPLGFVGGVYLAELNRVGSPAAWPSTKSAVKAVGVSILVELTAGLLAAAVWLVGVLAL